MELEKHLRNNQLFGFYQSLLTEKQQQMMSLYYEEDYSLSEIADLYHITRQAVRDNIKRTETILSNYESKLQLLQRRDKRQALLESLTHYVAPSEEATQLLTELQLMDE